MTSPAELSLIRSFFDACIVRNYELANEVSNAFQKRLVCILINTKINSQKRCEGSYDNIATYR
jgi:hypothetical protein